MPSGLGCALLGLLARGEQTGYELSRRMRRPVGFFWTATHSQIYPELARLTEAGLIDFEIVDGAGPRETKRYRITADGIAALVEWLQLPGRQQPVRDVDTLRAYSLWLLGRTDALGVVRAMRRRYVEQLRVLEGELHEIEHTPGAHDPSQMTFGNRLAVESGLRSARAGIEWTDWMIARLETTTGSGEDGPGE